MAEQLTLQVMGMTCGGCENAVRRVVSALPGVSQVSASHSDNEVRVEFDSARTDAARIADAIRSAGYHVS